MLKISTGGREKVKYRNLSQGDEAGDKIKTAFVLSGGGAKGAYQVGVINKLLSYGVFPDLVTGSSIGAFNGAFIAEFINRGMDVEEVTKKLEVVWAETSDLLFFNWTGLIENILTPLNIPSVFSNRNIAKIIDKYIQTDRNFCDYKKCQLSITGTNLDQRKSEIFDFNAKIPVKKAVLASMAYPVGLPAVEIEGNNYIDGGVLDNTPLKEAILWGAEKIFVIFLTPITVIQDSFHRYITEQDYLFSSPKNRSYSALRVLDQLIGLATETLMYGDFKKAEKINRLLQVINLYHNELPESFLEEIQKIYNLKKDSGKRMISITKIAPDYILEPPGTIGFYNREAVKELIERGKKDMETIYEKTMINNFTLIFRRGK